MNEKVTFHQLADDLSNLTGGTQATTEVFIKEFFATIADALKKGESVKIKNFGTFSLSGNDDGNIVFVPDKEIAEAINMPFSCFEAVELNDDVTDELLNSAIPNESNETPKTEIETESESISNDDIDEELTEITETIEHESENPEQEYEQEEIQVVVDEQQSEIEPVPIAERASDSYNYTNKRKTKKTFAKWWFGFIGIITGIIIGYFLYPIINNNTPTEIIRITKSETSPSVTVDSILPTPIPTNSITSNADKDTITSEIKIEQSKIVYDTIGRNRFLTTMSREYFGRMEFWVYIYEENKDILGNPNRIKPGTVIVIPSAEKYGIDDNNPECIDAAKLKAMEIYAPYQK